MAEHPHLPELALLALVDDELPPEEAAAARSHLVSCFPCGRLYEGLRRESEVLGGALAAQTAPKPEVRRELGWVVAAGLLISLGLVGLRRILLGVGEAAAEAPLPDALPLLSILGYRLFSLPDYPQLALQLAYGGIIVMTLIGIALASAAIRRPRAGAAPLLLAAALVPGLAALDTPAEALEVRSSNCRIAPEQVVDDDLVLMCETAAIAGAVRGDVYFLGRTLTVSGRVDGDLFGLGNEIAVDGSVGLSLRGLAQTIRVGGEVGRGLAGAGERISILPGATVGGSLIAGAGRVEMEGSVGRSLVAGAQHLELDGPVGGDLKFSGESLALGPGAAITGAANYYGPSEPERAPGAAEVQWTEPEPEEADPWGAVFGIALRWGMGIALGLVLALFASGPLTGIAAIGGRPLAPILVGLLLFVGLPFAAVLVAVTVVGIPLALATVALYLFLLYAARVAAAMVIGQAILGLASTGRQRVGRLALGLGILALAVEIPVAGIVVSLLTMFFGLGAFGLWVWRSRPSAALSRGGTVV